MADPSSSPVRLAGVGASRFDRGLVLGAFLPPDIGHHALIHHVQARCAQVVIAVTDRPGQLPETHDRASWMQAVHLDLDVVVLPDVCAWHGSALCVDECASAWADQVALLPAPFDLIVTAHPFGPLLAERLGATYLDPSTLTSADLGVERISRLRTGRRRRRSQRPPSLVWPAPGGASRPVSPGGLDRFGIDGHDHAGATSPSTCRHR